jgi:hypothetical protein
MIMPPLIKTRLVTEFLALEKVTVLLHPPYKVTVSLHPPYSPDLFLCDFFLFPKLKFQLSGKRYKSRYALGSDVYQYLMMSPFNKYKLCFQSWIERLKQCFQVVWEYFESQRNLK